MNFSSRLCARVSVSRRTAIKSLASGIGCLALPGLGEAAVAHDADAPRTALAPKTPHFPAKAKRVIFLCMNGGPSHVDLFDYKPLLQKHSGRPLNGQYGAKLLGSPFRFARQRESGQWMSELLPSLAGQADELCLIHSLQTDIPNHSQAFTQMHTGNFQFIRPSLGAWALYGLGTESAKLPGFITLSPPSDNGGARNYGSAFLPAIYQATKIGANQIPGFYAALLGVDQEPGPPLRNIENSNLKRNEQRDQLDLIRDLNAHKLKRDRYHPEIEGAIESFELAFRMQDEIPDLLDLRTESKSMRKLYGIGSDLPSDAFGRQCLLARRLSEAGVRFIEVTTPVGWDHHFMLKDELTKSCAATDQPVAALLADLKQRGLLKDTLVIWAGEFGRTPFAQSTTGRDHNSKGYTVWMAGGGVKAGMTYGKTDEYGHKAVHNPVHIHDWHATILRLLGFDHERLTYNYSGREFRLTDVYGQAVSDIIA